MRHSIPPLLIAILGVPAFVHAEEVPTLPTISVTAKGYAAQDSDTPVATTSINRDEIVRRGANNVGELLRGEPGLAVASDSAQGQNPVIRGQSRESIVLLVDGMRLNSAQPAGAIASFMSLGLAQRVEVVKGAASVLYGTGALGGAINVLLPQARFVSGVEFDAAASYDSASSGLRATGILNTSAGDHALMLGTSQARIGDYTSPSGSVARTGYDSGSLIGQYRFRLDGAQQLRLSLQKHTDTDVWYPGSTKPHPSPVVGSTTVHSPEQTRQLAEMGYNRQGAGESPVNVDVRVYRQNMERSIYGWSNLLNRDITTTRVVFGTDGLDAKADWLVHPAHLLSFGVNAWRMAASPDRQLAGAPTFSNWTPNTPFQNAQLEALGVYAQDDMRFGPLNLLAGLRHDTVKGHAASMNNGAVTTGLDRTDSASSGSVGAIYEVTPLVRPYANLSQAFRAAGMRERYESGSRSDGFYYAGSPQIAPETARQFELGIKGASEQWDYSVAAYSNRIDNYMTGQQLSGAAAIAACGAPNAAVCKKNVNLGQVTLTGLEAQARWQAVRGQWLSLRYSQVRGDNNDLNEPLFQMPADELSVGWQGTVAPGWTADTTLRLVDRQDRVATVFSNGTENATAGFATLDMGATWRYANERSLRLAIKNLADKPYHEHLAEGISGQEILASGRSFTLTWQGKF